MKQKERDINVHKGLAEPSSPGEKGQDTSMQANWWRWVTRSTVRFWSIGVALLSVVVAVAWMVLQLSLPADGYGSSFGKLAPYGATVSTDLVTTRSMGQSITQGDIIIAAGGHTIEEWARASLPGQSLSNREWQIGTTIPYTILRKGEEQTVFVTLARLSLADVLRAGTSTYFLVLLILALTVFVVIQKPDELAPHILLVCASATTVLQVHEVVDLQVSLIVHPLLFWSGVLLENFGICFCYAPLVHAFLIFPERKKIIQRYPAIIWLVYLVYPALTLMGALLGEPTVTGRLAGAGWGSTLSMILLFVILGGGIAHSFFTARTFKSRSQIRWIAWGFGTGMTPLVFLHLLPRDLFGQAILSWEMALIPIFLAPISLVVAMVRHNLFDIELIIHRSLVYSTLTVLLSGFYLLLIYLLTQVTQAIAPARDETMTVFIATLTIALAFAPLQRRVQAMIDRAFYQNKLDYQKVLAEMSTRLSTNIILERLVSLLTKELPRRLQIVRTSLLVLDQQGRTLSFLGDEDGERIGAICTDLPIDHPLAEYLCRLGHPLLRSRAEQHLSNEAFTFMQGLLKESVELCIPLIVGQRLVGVYNLGAKLSGISYTHDEVQLLTVLGQQAAVSVENARLYQEIEEYSHILEQKVDQRTNKLQAANEKLEQEIIERKRAEERVRRLLDQQIAVNQLALALGETRDLDTIYGTIYERVGQLLDTDTFIVASYDDETRLIRAEYVISEGKICGVTNFPPIPLAKEEHGSQSRVIHTGEPFYCPDLCNTGVKIKTAYKIADDGIVSKVPPPAEKQQDSTNSALYVPMKIEGNVIGVMQVQSHRLDAYSQEDIGLLSSVANVAAVATQNARLYGEVERELAERVQAEKALQDLNTTLEARVTARTAEIRAEKERSETILRSVGNAIMMLDQTLHVQYVNPAFTALTGYTAEEVLGQRANTVGAAAGSEQVQQSIEFALAEGRSWQGEASSQRKDGRIYDATIIISPLRDAERNLMGYVSTHQDVSQQKALGRARNRFLDNVSHQLRTPVTTIQLYVHLMQRTEMSEKNRDYLGIMRTEIDRLIQLMQDILEMTALDSGKAVITWEPISLPAMIEDAITRGTSQTEISDLTVTVAALPPNLPVVEGDHDRLVQALGEVVENAIVFAGGHVTLQVETVEDEGATWVMVAVQDTGPGIPLEEQEKVFDRFFRGSLAEAGHIPGVGLGLSITQEIIRAHGGRVTVDADWNGSSGEEGSTFKLWLPATA
ncbi:MAG: GAF domain-containing protein [Chloroflexi bacterium]|nr:GAF domain-containing protein [Chloroflexota bacterium]